jgi:uncharacterized protein (TIGR03437 family)
VLLVLVLGPLETHIYEEAHTMNNGARFSQGPLLAAVLFAVWPALAQKTTSISLSNIGGMTSLVTAGRSVSLGGTGAVNPLGNASVTFSGSQDQVTTGLTQGTFTFFFNRLDSFSVSVPPQLVSKVTTLALPGTITGGTGAYSGATGSVTYTFTYTGVTSNSGTFTLSGSGNITVGKTTTAISLVNFSGPASVTGTVSGTLTTIAPGSVTPFGNVTVNFSGIQSLSSPGQIQGTLTFVFNANDSFNASFSFVFNLFSSSANLPSTIAGGTGVFRGATGSLAANLTLNSDGTFALTGSGTLVQPQQGTPIITSVSTAFGSSSIAQNTWLQIQGTNLTPTNTPPGGVYWSNAPEFASNRMPTQVGGISVTVDGKPAYIWWFCSAATTPFCASDQINALSPLDGTVGQVQVVVTRQTVSSAPMGVNMLAVAPSFLLFDTTGHSVAQHTDFSDLGPPNLFPGVSTTPARPSEVVIVYAIGFGLPTASLVDGSAAQSGSLPVLPICQMAGAPAPVLAAVLIDPGLYALLVTVPAGATKGDNVVSCSYQDSTTPAGNLITVQP